MSEPGVENVPEGGQTERGQTETSQGTEREREHEEVAQVADSSAHSLTTAATGSVVQSTLATYRTPVLPNLAKAALERLQKRTSEEYDSENSDFQPPKKRKVEENSSEEDNEVSSV